LGHEQRSVKLAQHIHTRWRVPVECKELADVVAREHGNIHQSLAFNAGAVLRLLTRCDALRRPERFLQALQACECDARGRLGKQAEPYPQADRLKRCLHAALAVDTASISAAAMAQGLSGAAVGQRIEQAREIAVGVALDVA
jgi:tRNA nucleotidyltransferase (CCA-adding enzyme)